MTDRLDVTESGGLHRIQPTRDRVKCSLRPCPSRPPISTDPSRGAKVRIGDRIFRGLAEGSGILIVVIIAAIGVFLLWRAIPALARNEENFFLYGGNWVTTDTSAMQFGILDLLQVTVFVSVFALLLAMPVALGIAIFLTQYAPRRVAGPLAYMVDLLAAVPSIIYGVWGLYVLAPVIKPLAMWLNENLGWLFLFQTGNASVAGGGTIFTAGHRAGGDDPADHHRGHPRGVRPDAARPDRGGAGAGRHPVGGRARPRCCRSGCPATSAARCSASAARSVRRSRC